MASDPSVEREDAGHGFWWHAALGGVGITAPSCLGMWLLQGWVERSFGVSGDLAGLMAGMPGGVLGILAIRAVLGTRPGADPEQRRREAGAEAAGHRQFRRWVTVFLGLLLFQQLGALVIASLGGSRGGGDRLSAVLAVLMAVTSVQEFLPSRAGTPPGRVEADQAERCEALRVGYLALVALGSGAAVAEARWPWVAGQAWSSALLASVLASHVRMAMFRARTARRAGGAA